MATLKVGQVEEIRSSWRGNGGDKTLYEITQLYGLTVNEAYSVLSSVEFEIMRRASTIRKSHPLGLQLCMGSGVANGVMVVRNVKKCRELLERTVKRSWTFDIVSELNESGTSSVTVLREKISKSRFRSITGDPVLTAAFWNLFHPV